jgi:pyruvate formate lyase activating enzyme
MGQDVGYDELLAFLDARRGRLQGVCVSGGEPTLHKDLPLLLSEIKARGFEVKLDTNGTDPELLLSLINDGLVDYVAMDIKNSPDKYLITAGFSADGAGGAELLENVRLSASILMQGRVDFEFRTTLMKELHTVEDMEAIGLWLRGPAKLFLQTYREEGDLIIGGFTPFARGETEALLTTLRKYLPNAEIRE